MHLLSKYSNVIFTGFRSLIERSINAWTSNIYVGAATGVNKEEAISKSASTLRALTSMEVPLESREFYFFQDRGSFIKQTQFKNGAQKTLTDTYLSPKHMDSQTIENLSMSATIGAPRNTPTLKQWTFENSVRI